MTDTDMLYMASLEKRNAGLEAKVAELKSKHWNELRRTKELLKAAVEDMNSNNICFDINACNVCTDSKCISCDTFKWRYTDEALKLIES